MDEIKKVRGLTVGETYGQLTVLSKSGPLCECLCSCGVKVTRTSSAVKVGRVRSCGCLRARLLSERTTKPIEVGTVFGRLTVVKYNGRRCECKCSCGAEAVFVASTKLRMGKTQSCGCYQKDQAHNAALHPVKEGTRFGKLVVIRQVRTHCKCQCDCGKTTVVETKKLRNGHTKSCGCFRVELALELSQKKLRPHGETAFTCLYDQYRCQAESRNIAFELSRDAFRAITKQDCYFCGTKPAQVKTSHGALGSYVYNGVDRMDNSRGYADDNCKPCCGFCNIAKSTQSETEFYDWVLRLSKYPNNALDSKSDVASSAQYKHLYCRYRSSAKIRKLEFTLTRNDFIGLAVSDCCYCGREPHRETLNGSECLYNGLDRIDSSKGYVVDNVVTCCKDCNSAKSNGSIKDLIDWANRVVMHRRLCQQQIPADQ